MLLLLLALSHASPLTDALADGDVVLHRSRSAQSTALRAATGSPYTHVGLVFRRVGTWQVLEAVGPVKWTPLDDWVARGEGRHVVALRPRRSVDVSALRAGAEAFAGKPYDLLFQWSDDRIYCSELVYKAFAPLGVEIGEKAALGSFDLTSPEVKALIASRTGGDVDADEPVVAPSSILADRDLVVVYSTDPAHPAR